MDPATISQIISTVGFPIAMCLVMAYYIKYVTESHQKESKDLTEAIQSLKESLIEILAYIRKGDE